MNGIPPAVVRAHLNQLAECGDRGVVEILVVHDRLGHQTEITRILDLARLSTDLTELETSVARIMDDPG